MSDMEGALDCTCEIRRVLNGADDHGASDGCRQSHWTVGNKVHWIVPLVEQLIQIVDQTG